MSNKPLGRYEFQAGGRTYTMQFTINALCALEAELGSDDVLDVAAVMAERPSLARMRLMFWAGLTQHHKGLTKEDAGDIMDAIGLEAAGGLVTMAIAAAFGAGAKSGPFAGQAASAPAAGSASSANGSSSASTPASSGI